MTIVVEPFITTILYHNWHKQQWNHFSQDIGGIKRAFVMVQSKLSLFSYVLKREIRFFLINHDGYIRVTLLAFGTREEYYTRLNTSFRYLSGRSIQRFQNWTLLTSPAPAPVLDVTLILGDFILWLPDLYLIAGGGGQAGGRVRGCRGLGEYLIAFLINNPLSELKILGISDVNEQKERLTEWLTNDNGTLCNQKSGLMSMLPHCSQEPRWSISPPLGEIRCHR